MSFTKEKRNAIKRYMLEKIDEGENGAIAAASAFGISQNTAYRYLRELAGNHVIEKGPLGYVLTGSSYEACIDLSSGARPDETDIFIDIVSDRIKDFPENIYNIWAYSFSEMMNNAIEHSEADRVYVKIKQNALNTLIAIQDNGVGAFENIKSKLNLSSLKEAARELFKGKITTDRAHHSGEGIFFTCRALDDFSMLSGGIIFSRDKFGNTFCSEILESDDTAPFHGTTVRMKLSNSVSRELADVFREFSSPDDGFYKTSIPVKNMFDLFPVSRSQARRLCRSIDRFREVELDFTGVGQIGQGFAHEIFVVYVKEHPDVSITAINANEQTQFMISRALKTSGVS